MSVSDEKFQLLNRIRNKLAYASGEEPEIGDLVQATVHGDPTQLLPSSEQVVIEEMDYGPSTFGWTDQDGVKWWAHTARYRLIARPEKKSS